MSRYVRSISYFRPVVWSRDQNYEVWRSGVERRLWSEEELAEGHREVVSALEEEAAVARVGSVSRQIKRSVELFPGLESIMMVSGSLDQIKEARMQGTLVGFEKSLGIESYQGMWELICLMLGAKAAQIKALRAGKLDCSFFSRGVVESAKTWWGWIRVLELEMLRCGGVANTEGLKEFLVCLPELEKLGVSFDPHSELGAARLVEVVDGKTRWKNLLEISVYGMSCAREGLLEVLRGHKEHKLDRFRMECVELEAGDALVPLMWEIRRLKLSIVGVGGWIRCGSRVWGGEVGVTEWIQGEDGVRWGGFGKLERWLTDVEMEGECPLEHRGGADVGGDSSGAK